MLIARLERTTCPYWTIPLALAVQLLAVAASSPSGAAVSSRPDAVGYLNAGSGSWGSWIPGSASFTYCNPGKYATGYQIKIESPGRG